VIIANDRLAPTLIGGSGALARIYLIRNERMLAVTQRSDSSWSNMRARFADTVSELTMVGGRVVYGAGDFADFDEAVPPAAMPDWSPVRSFGGYAAWGDAKADRTAVRRAAASACGCAHRCDIHGHDHATAWSRKLPIRDLKSFWGALGCACWAV
jgi:hypothetical protein